MKNKIDVKKFYSIIENTQPSILVNILQNLHEAFPLQDIYILEYISHNRNQSSGTYLQYAEKFSDYKYSCQYFSIIPGVSIDLIGGTTIKLFPNNKEIVNYRKNLYEPRKFIKRVIKYNKFSNSILIYKATKLNNPIVEI